MGSRGPAPAGGSRLVALLVALVLLISACASASPVPAASTTAGAGSGASPSSVGVGGTASPSASESSSPSATSSASSVAPSAVPAAKAEKIGQRLLVDKRQYLTVKRAEEWRGKLSILVDRYIAVLVNVEGVVDAPFNKNLFSVDTGTGETRQAIAGRRPQFSSGQRLRVGYSYEAWLTFSVPVVCACELRYSLPVGGGKLSEPVRITLDKIGQPTTETVPQSTGKPAGNQQLAGITASFFGPNVTLNTYQVTGRTTSEIIASTEQNGPYLEWLHGRATALTQAQPSFNATGQSTPTGCRVVTTAAKAISFTYTVTLPGWVQPPNVSSSTVDWWKAEIREIAVHERHHIELYRAAEDELDRVIRASSCTDVAARTKEIISRLNRDQCEFDMREYGAELGLSLDDCLNNG
jgi:predicted secreted Zn-dependent protease